MKITDLFQGHRSITLSPAESLDSPTIIAALVAKGQSLKDATDAVGTMYDALEEYEAVACN